MPLGEDNIRLIILEKTGVGKSLSSNRIFEDSIAPTVVNNGVRILTFGPTGHGKSSLLNGVCAALRELIASTGVNNGVRILTFGPTGHGKSSLLNGFFAALRELIASTGGVDFEGKLSEDYDASVQRDPRNTAGQERFRSITKHQYRSVQDSEAGEPGTCAVLDEIADEIRYSSTFQIFSERMFSRGWYDAMLASHSVFKPTFVRVIQTAKTRNQKGLKLQLKDFWYAVLTGPEIVLRTALDIVGQVAEGQFEYKLTYCSHGLNRWYLYGQKVFHSFILKAVSNISRSSI